VLEINKGHALKVFEMALSKARHWNDFILLPPTSRGGCKVKNTATENTTRRRHGESESLKT
jgi:hypothetical protein